MPEYRDIPDCPGYRVGDDGSVWSEKRPGRWQRDGVWRRLKAKLDRYGYLVHALCVDGKPRRFGAHQLVLIAFRGPCPCGMQAAHDNGIRSDNRLDNLFWKTPLANIADKVRHGTMGTKLNSDAVENIVSLLADPKIPMREIAARHGVSRKTIQQIADGSRWRIVSTDKPTVAPYVPKGESKQQAKLTEEQVREIRSTPSRRGVTAEFARRFGVSTYTVYCARTGRKWNHIAAIILVALIYRSSQAQLPPQSGPLGIPATPAEISLGSALFFDPILSADRSVACASCHDPAKAYSDGLPVARGIAGLLGNRKTPALFNVGYVKGAAFHDGRAIETSDQALLPLTNPREMGFQNLQQAINRLNDDKNYYAAFAAIYGPDQATRLPVTGRRVSRVLACFESTLTVADTPASRYIAGDKTALSPEARIGFELFLKADCQRCHPPGLWSDYKLHNVGFELATRGRIVDQGAGGVRRNALLGRDKTDTELAADAGKFRTPTLIGLGRQRYFGHNGAFTSLEQVISHFNHGAYVRLASQQRAGKAPVETRERNIDRLLVKQNWTAEQEAFVCRFLREGLEPIDYPMIEVAR